VPAFTVSDPAVPPSLHGPVLVDAHGRHRYWSTVASHLAHAHLRPSTVGIHLSAIERLYAFAEQLWRNDTLDAVIARWDLARIDDLLHAFFSKLRREAQRRGALGLRHRFAWQPSSSSVAHGAELGGIGSSVTAVAGTASSRRAGRGWKATSKPLRRDPSRTRMAPRRPVPHEGRTVTLHDRRVLAARRSEPLCCLGRTS